MVNETTNGRIQDADMIRAKTLKVGDRVTVLRACRLPSVEEAIGSGVIESMTKGSYPAFFVSGFPCARTAEVLRPVTEAGR